jgi:DNA-binding NtrC family response regulator
MAKPKHILVVDHDGDVREVVAALLLDLGYRVSLTKTDETVRAFLASADSVDLIVLDASTPNEPGVKVALQAKDRGIHLVMISGNPEQMKAYHERSDQLLYKPFRRAELERAVQEALGSNVFGQRVEDPS